jgi:RNA polymerase sigma-70 factor (ECF subfamily)
VNEQSIIKGCIAYDAAAQKALYKMHAPKMYAICLRYVKDTNEAKDIMQEGFIKVFAGIQKFRAEGSLEGWIKRILVNTALNHIRKNKVFNQHLDVTEMELSDVADTAADQSLNSADFSEEELLEEIDQLPDLYKIIFNLYCLDNYSHKMIAEQLSITEETSRIRLNRARKMLQERLLKLTQIRMKNMHRV